MKRTVESNFYGSNNSMEVIP